MRCVLQAPGLQAAVFESQPLLLWGFNIGICQPEDQVDVPVQDLGYVNGDLCKPYLAALTAKAVREHVDLAYSMQAPNREASFTYDPSYSLSFGSPGHG